MKSLGVLEQEIVCILWRLGSAPIKDIHQAILSDPDRELTAPSILNVLRRLEKKGWIKGQKKDRIWYWSTTISEEEAKIKKRLQSFTAISYPGGGEVLASFANHLDHVSMEKLTELTQRLQAIRTNRDNDREQN